MSDSSAQTQQQIVSCPICSKPVDTLMPIESGTRLMMQKESFHPEAETACSSCLKELSKNLNAGAKLKEHEDSKIKAVNELWKGRITLIKHGKSCIDRKDYANAAVAYEKYLKVVEVVYNKPFQLITPQDFKDRPKEVTVIASCLWDLLRVYDLHASYHARQEDLAKKLAEFLRFSPLYPVVIRKAEIEIVKAKNPNAFKYFLKNSDNLRARCFVATVTFEDEFHPTVMTLRQFRDRKLKKSPQGRAFVAFYYKKARNHAHKLTDKHTTKFFLRIILNCVAALLRKIL